MALVIVIVLIVYTLLVFNCGRQYEVQQMIEFCEKELERRGVSVEDIEKWKK